MTKFGMSVTLCYVGDVETVEIEFGGKIIIPEMAIKMKADDTEWDVTNNTPIDDGMRDIRKYTKSPKQ